MEETVWAQALWLLQEYRKLRGQLTEEQERSARTCLEGIRAAADPKDAKPSTCRNFVEQLANVLRLSGKLRGAPPDISAPQRRSDSVQAEEPPPPPVSLAQAIEAVRELAEKLLAELPAPREAAEGDERDA